MKKIYNNLLILSILAMVILSKITIHASEQTIIAIDPGHGGENLGAIYTNPDGKEFVEKEMTLITALAMKEELEKYDNVSIYLTREQDVVEDILLVDRAKFAKEKGADVLISLHYNRSVSGILYGSEVWVPSKGQIYSESASLATEFMKSFESMGLFNRGIKTRLNDYDNDYYGILRQSVALDLNAILVEHCHLENPKDFGFYNSEENMRALGVADATAVAKYYGLSSSILGVDYSGYTISAYPIPRDIVRPDTTAPEYCEIELIDYKEESGEVTFELTGVDNDGYLLYYTYSLDNGVTWVPLVGWGNSEKVQITDTVILDETPVIIGKVYNGYDISTESNLINLPKYEGSIETTNEKETLPKQEIVEDQVSVFGKDNIVTIYHDEKESNNQFKFIVVIIIVITLLLLVTFYFLHRNKMFAIHSFNKINLKRISSL